MHGEPSPDERREITYGSFLAGYFTLLISLVIVAVVGERLFGFDIYRSISVLCGVMFILAGIGVPRRLYLIVRSTGWFSYIAEPSVMRALLILLGAGLILLGIFASAAYLHPRA